MVKDMKFLEMIFKSSTLKSIFLTQLLLSFGWYISTPFIAVYLTTSLHADAYQAGIFVGLGMLSYSLFSPFLGRAIDFRYENYIIYISSFFLIIPFLSFYFIKQISIFYIASVMIGIGRAGFSTVLNWSISSSVEVKSKKLAFSLRYMLVNVGSVIAPLFSSMLIKNIHMMFLVSLMFYIYQSPLKMRNLLH
jgi:MFS family permease